MCSYSKGTGIYTRIYWERKLNFIRYADLKSNDGNI